MHKTMFETQQCPFLLSSKSHCFCFTALLPLFKNGEQTSREEVAEIGSVLRDEQLKLTEEEVEGVNADDKLLKVEELFEVFLLLVLGCGVWILVLPSPPPSKVLLDELDMDELVSLFDFRLLVLIFFICTNHQKISLRFFILILD